MSNSGTSINFDAQAIHDAEEAEYHREEKERENEVCFLVAICYLHHVKNNKVCFLISV